MQTKCVSCYKTLPGARGCLLTQHMKVSCEGPWRDRQTHVAYLRQVLQSGNKVLA